MNQQFRLRFLPANRLWLVGVIITVALLATQAVHAHGLRIADAYVPAQYVDLDGDGQREIFSATMATYDDGAAEGLMLLGEDLQLDLEKGHTDCMDGMGVANAQGTLYQIENGDLTEIGLATATVQSAEGGGYGILLLDVTNSMSTIRVVVTGSLHFTVNPCTS